MLSEFALSPVHRTGMPAAFTGPQRVGRIGVRFEDRVSDGSLICALLRSADAHNPGSAVHAVRVCRLARLIAHRFPMSPAALATLSEAALLHDIGKLAIDTAILRKPDVLTESERHLIRLHVPAGVQLVRSIPALARAAVLIRGSHEWLNGGGYPRGVRAAAISLGSRIIAVADAFDALTHVRVYRAPLPPALALEQLRLGAGLQFDPRVLAALGEILASGVLHPAANSPAA